MPDDVATCQLCWHVFSIDDRDVGPRVAKPVLLRGMGYIVMRYAQGYSCPECNHVYFSFVKVARLKTRKKRTSK